ncbi:MAG: YkgJ family cysteine cluster protein [bacterium]|nr:YkgJ family cysteine cluster protein [bacterium]
MNYIISNSVKYQCIQCGQCCRTNWLIGIDDTSYRRLIELDWTEKQPELASRQLFQLLPKPLLTGERYTFSRVQNQACIFLLPDNRCQIHVSFGFDTKAQVCKEFPYHFVKTPDGIVVGVSFACTAVSKQLGTTLDQHITELETIYPNHYRIEKIDEPITLYSGMTISWQEYKQLESCLLQILNDTAYSLETALIAGSILINVCVSLKQVELIAQKENKKPNETVLSGLNKLQLEKFRHIFDIALKIKKAKKTSRAYLAPFITWIEFVAQKQNRFALVFNLYKNYFKYRKGRGTISPLITDGKKIRWELVTPIRFDIQSPELADYLRRYYTHMIFRKTLLPIHGVYRGYHTLLAVYALGKLIAKSAAAADNRAQVVLTDVQFASAKLDTQLVLHAQFSRLFTVSPYITLLIDRLYLQPYFPQIVIQ